LAPITVWLGSDLICRNHFGDRDRNRSTNVLFQRFAEAHKRFVRKIRRRASLCRIGHKDKSGLERSLFDLSQGILASPVLRGNIVAQATGRNG
jgi:3-methyladenine DNA glycosylase AlkD